MNLGGVRASNGRAPIAPILAFVVQDSLVTSALITPNVLLSDPSSIQSAWVSSSQWRIAYQSLVSERELRVGSFGIDLSSRPHLGRREVSPLRSARAD